MHSSTNYQRINYYPTKTDLTDTMLYLHWFRFYHRNDSDHIRYQEPSNEREFPNKSVRLFFIMQSTEGTFIPATYEVTSQSKPLTYLQWCELIQMLLSPIEKEIDKVLRTDLRGYLEWAICEYIGWTSDGRVQNPEENKQAFRFKGHLTGTMD